ncbi:MAG: hypothetical protein ACOZE5_03280 [Verrucomicrobiota bacterium]
MKNITSTLSGLSSSLFLSVGLTEIAQKLDPVSQQPFATSIDAHGPSYCVPSYFTPKPGR